ncbi:TetR family transcriptional regulator [Actinacidiphila sp. ITFR-21]|uniref:TetR/AcrR family transcriptional regulator n=1 Tax=Actinacidiphila sp. ITFR-21 TaxID=3075199 RepID=UPI00288C34A3|nr:TetR family transcriptional regulator [Streptomyces sp. ITFR-21]WNI17112.1 TetR family transcriptional regulator [Streptomyces sp. ITFR-21]
MGAARRRGRPAGPPSGATKDRILAAAREEFSAHGYDRTSVRSIGRAAGVDSALVHHYFGSKEQIFAAAVEVAFAPALDCPEAVTAVPGGAPGAVGGNGLPGGTDGVGERVARFMLRSWENPATREPLLAIVRSAVTNEAAATVLRGLVSRTVLARVAGELTVPDPEFRVQLAATQLIGMVTLRYVIKLEPLASADPEQLVHLMSPPLHHYLTAPGITPHLP